jgi:RNA polymerase sigma-70 factor (ECF subfamily)
MSGHGSVQPGQAIPNTEDLFLKVTEKDYERLIAPIEDRMVGLVWRIVRDPDDAEDAFQEALERIWRRIGKIMRHPNPHALIVRICVNSAYDSLRKRSRRHRRQASAPIEETRPDSAPSPSETASGKETESEILNAIGRLSRSQAQAVLLRCAEGQDYDEIAKAMGCHPGTARTHVARGRARLSEMLPHLAPRNPKEVNENA